VKGARCGDDFMAGVQVVFQGRRGRGVVHAGRQAGRQAGRRGGDAARQTNKSRSLLPSSVVPSAPQTQSRACISDAGTQPRRTATRLIAMSTTTLPRWRAANLIGWPSWNALTALAALGAPHASSLLAGAGAGAHWPLRSRRQRRSKVGAGLPPSHRIAQPRPSLSRIFHILLVLLRRPPSSLRTRPPAHAPHLCSAAVPRCRRPPWAPLIPARLTANIAPSLTRVPVAALFCPSAPRAAGWPVQRASTNTASVAFRSLCALLSSLPTLCPL